MEQIIYGDILFIVNFSMDFLALYITAKILHTEPHFAALIMSAGIGGIYGVVALFFAGNTVIDTFINIFVALLICFIVYGASTILLLIRNTVIFYGISFLIGGIMTVIFNFANKGLCGRGIVINGNSAALYGDISPLAFIFAALASVLFTYLCSAVTKRIHDRSKAELSITIDGKTATLNGLVDSGNLLCEPFGALPCVICSYDAIKDILPTGLLPLFRDKNVGLLEYADPKLAAKIRIIPMRSLGAEGIILGILPDEVKINGASKNVCIACDPDSNGYSDTASIIPMSIM